MFTLFSALSKYFQVSSCVKAVVLVAAVALLFRLDLAVLFNDALKSELTSYILLVPVLFAYLVYRKRKMLRAVIPVEGGNQPKLMRHIASIAGVLLAVTAVLLYWYGSYTFTPLELHMVALPMFASGLTLILFNVQTLRQLAFPIGFLLFLAPPPSEMLYMVGATLAIVGSEASSAIVKALGISSTIISEYGNPTIVVTRADGTPLQFTVDIACSGIYSLIGFLLFAFFVAYIIRDKLWKKLAVILTGLPLMYALNILRITIILLIGYSHGAELAMQAFHILGGWILVFLGTLLLLTISEKIFKTQIFFNPSIGNHKCIEAEASNQRFCLSCNRITEPAALKFTKRDEAKIVAILAAVALLTSIQAPVFALTQGPPAVLVTTTSGQQIPGEFLPKVQEYSLSFLYRDTEFEAKAKQEFSLVYMYTPSSKSKAPVWVAIEIASTRSSLHRWEVCLITWPLSKGYAPRVTQIKLEDLQLTQNPAIISRFFAFEYKHTKLLQAVLYWYETAAFTINATSEQKNVKISLIAYPKSLEELPQIQEQLATLAAAIVNYWQPVKTWSQIATLMSQNGNALASATTAALAAAIAVYTLEERRQKKANANAYQKLSKVNKQLIDVIRETEKRTTPTLNKIAETYQKTTRQTIDKKQLLETLKDLEKTGIIKSRIANEKDQPTQTWKTQL